MRFNINSIIIIIIVIYYSIGMQGLAEIVGTFTVL
jgi:hypothetical protein